MLLLLSTVFSATVTVSWIIPTAGGVLPPKTVTIGDIVSFSWVTGHTVGLFAGASQFTSCSFVGATAITVTFTIAKLHSDFHRVALSLLLPVDLFHGLQVPRAISILAAMLECTALLDKRSTLLLLQAQPALLLPAQ